jgi:hypothetical protein
MLFLPTLQRSELQRQKGATKSFQFASSELEPILQSRIIHHAEPGLTIWNPVPRVSHCFFCSGSCRQTDTASSANRWMRQHVEEAHDRSSHTLSQLEVHGVRRRLAHDCCSCLIEICNSHHDGRRWCICRGSFAAAAAPVALCVL